MKKQKEHGFTLIELLVAVFILCVVLLAISSMVYSVMRATSNSKETSIATTLMQDKMEALKNTSLLSLAPGNDTPTLGQHRLSPTMVNFHNREHQDHYRDRELDQSWLSYCHHDYPSRGLRQGSRRDEKRTGRIYSDRIIGRHFN